MREIAIEHPPSKVDTDHTKIFQGILDIDLSICTLSVFMATVVKDDLIPHFQHLQIEEPLANGFREIVTKFLTPYQSRWNAEDILFPEYVLDSKPEDYQIEHLNISSYATLLEQLTPLASLADIEQFDQKDEKFIAGLRFYVITIQPRHGNPIYFFRHYTRRMILGRTLVAMLTSNGVYDCVRSSICQFDAEIDCMSRDGVMFIFDKKNFQDIFRLFDTIRINARQTLATFETIVPIHNFDLLVRACERDVQKLRKLQSISSKPYMGKVTIEKLKTVIKMNNLSIEIKEVEGKEQLVYNPQARNKWEILNLFNDDYLKSPLTDVNYEVSGKRQI